MVGREVPSRAAVLFGKRQPHQAEAGHLCNYGVRELLFAVEVGGSGPDLTLGEVARQISPLALLVGRVEVQCTPPDPSVEVGRALAYTPNCSRVLTSAAS